MIAYQQIHTLGVPSVSDGLHDILMGNDGIVVLDSTRLLSGDIEIRDGRGLVLCPGFVDMHSHSDLYRFRSTSEGDALGDVPKLLQGCTFQVLGQDGYSAAPVRPDDISDYSQFISGLDGELDSRDWNWSTFGEYVTENRKIPGTRTAHLVGHSTLRRYVSGMADRKLTVRELQSMTDLLRDSLLNGACGLSTGLVYAPASFSDEAELFALASVLAEFDSVMFVHLRSESYNVISAAQEVANACLAAGCRLHISHIKTAGSDNWRFTPHLIRMLDEMVNERGLRLTADLHPYIAGSTMASVFLPGWLQSDDNRKTLEMLRSKEHIERARLQILEDVTSWDNWWRFSSGWQGIRFAECHDKSLLGRPLDRVILENVSADQFSFEAFEWFFGVIADSNLQASIISFNNSEDNIAPFLRLPYVSLCTDGLINPHGLPHPRTYGAFPRLFRRFQRELGVISLEDAVQIASIRGRTVVGNQPINDFVVFNPETFTDESTFEDPTTPPTGLATAFIGGQEIMRRNHGE